MNEKPKVMLLIEAARAYERDLLRGVARYSDLHGPWRFSRESPFWEKRSHKALLDQLRNMDGIIMRESSYLPEIIKLRIPTIVSNCTTESIPGLPNIVSDHEAIGLMAAEHLIERGFRHFAFCGYTNLFWSMRRCHGFQQRVLNAGCHMEFYRPPQNARKISSENDQQSLADWLTTLPKPVGVMACIDERAQQVADACKMANLSVPEQVAIVGVDNDEMICKLSSISMSSVAITAEQGGYEAAALLDKLMHGKKANADQQFIEIKPYRVVTRASTDITAVDDAHVSSAVKYIHDNCRQIIYVEDVAKAAGLSRRVLEKRFRALLNHSVNDHIRLCRIRLIMMMLTESAMPVSEIAIYLGFPDAAHIARYFKKIMHTSPAEYRRKYRQ